MLLHIKDPLACNAGLNVRGGLKTNPLPQAQDLPDDPGLFVLDLMMSIALPGEQCSIERIWVLRPFSGSRDPHEGIYRVYSIWVVV